MLALLYFPGIQVFLLGFSRRLSSLVSLSPRDSPLPLQLFASWLLIIPFVSFSTFRVFYCVRLIKCDFALALPLFPFLGSYGDVLFDSLSSLVSCAFSLWPLVISSASPISVPLLILLIVCGFGFSSSTFAVSFLFVCLFPFLLSHLVTFLCGLSHMSWPSLLLFLLRGFFHVFLLEGLFSGLFVCATISSPLNFFSLGRVCSPLGSYSPLLPSCLATASHGFNCGLPPMRCVASCL